MVYAMNNDDRKKYGDKLVQYNLDMVAYFTMAYHRRDEHISFDAGDKHYDIKWNDYPSYKSVYCQKNGVGGFIGYTFWQAVASLYPIDVDVFVSEEITIFFVRYVDDTVIVTDNKEMALAMIPEYRERLRRIGITLHPTKFYCQPAEHGVEFLGYHILPGRVHLKNRTIKRAIAVARSVGRGKRNYVDAINSYLGMIEATSDQKYAVTLLDNVHHRGVSKDYENLKVSIIRK